MNVKLSRRQTIIYIVLTLGLLLLLSVWPCKIIHRNVNVKSSEKFLMESKPANVQNNIAQVFVADGTRLEAINLYICNDMAGENINFSLYDASLTRIYSRDIEIASDATFPGMTNLKLDYDVEKGVAYIYTLYGVTNDLIVGLQENDPYTSITVGGLNYAGEEDSAHDVIVNFNYIADFSWWQVLIIYSIVSIALVLIVAVINVLAGVSKRFSISPCEGNNSKWNSDYITVQRLLKCVLIPIIVIITLVMLIAIYPLGLFRTELSSIIFYDFGVLLLSVGLIYLICYKRDDNLPLISIEIVKNNLSRWLVVISIGHILWYCFEYMNGLYEIHHEYAARRILIWVLLMLIFTYSREELLKIVNAIWLIGSGIFAYFYAKPYVGVNEEELIYRLNAYIIVLAGPVLINMIMSVVDGVRKKKSFPPICISNIVMLTTFAALIIAFSNTRWWPTYLVVILFLVVFRLAFWSRASIYLNCICDGILLNFVMMVAFSLLHRPYYRYIYYRYNMTYFTVTMTATHMSLIVCAAIVKILIRLRSKDNIRKLIPDLALFGATVCYLVFTLSRTAFVCIGVTGTVVLLAEGLLCFDKGKRLKSVGVQMLTMILAVLVMFPITFTATRIVPAISDDPVIYDYEHVEETMYRGTPTDSFGYIDISRFFDVFMSKVLDVGDTITSVDYVEDMESYFHTTVIKEVASATDDISFEKNVDEDDTEEEDVSNGRIDIYRSYVNQLNLWGHDEMGAILDDGTEAAHAHSIYLQILFDFGIIPGMYVIIFMIYMGIASLLRVIKCGKSNEYTWLIPVLLLGLLTAGTVEWVFHACNPFGLAVMLAILPLVYKDKENEKSI